MNRLRGRRKTCEGEPAVRPSTRNDFSFPFNMLGRFKKSHEEPEPEVDVSTSLAQISHDDFRTSIVMNELSVRFSLLRERESQTTSSPKARDDSALYNETPSQMTPRKQCHCQDNEGGSPKRPATRSGRIEGRRAEVWKGESIMNRGRTTESNNLFGGRQKVNIIPSSGSCGRALYCDDIAPSAFQHWKQQEKERKAAEGKESEHASKDSIAPSFSQNSPSVSFIEHQEQVLQREQSHNKTLGRSRTGTLPTSIQTTGLSGPQERAASKTVRTKTSAPSLRTFPPREPGTPPPLPIEISPAVLESKEIQPSLPTPPLSATVRDLDSGSLRVKKNHKAAALGLQPRPSVKYDEEEYVRRQRQIQSRIATGNPISRTGTNKKQINRRSRSFSGLNNAQIDRSPSTFRPKNTVDGELLPRTCFQRTEYGKQSTVETPRLASRQRSGSAAAASPGTDRSSSRDHHPAISPPPQMPNQARVNSVTRREKKPDQTQLSEPRAVLGKLDNNLSRENSATLSKNELGFHKSASQPHDSGSTMPTILNVVSDSWGLKDNDRDDMVVTPLDRPPTDGPKPAANNPRGSDDFARHLSDGAKRIREKMTMHAESDHSDPPSSELPTGDGSDLPPARSGVFNALRSKTSNGTLNSRRLLPGNMTSSVTVSIPYESFRKSVARDPSGPKSAATQSFLPLHDDA